LVVAELSGNHNGNFDRAVALMRAAAGAGADAVKLQTYTPDTMTLDLDDPRFVVNQELWRGRTLHDLYAEAMTPWEWHDDLFSEARSLGLQCFSSPFDVSAIELLESLECPAYKIASLEIGDLALISAAASTGKPVIISTGGADTIEIDEAVETCRAAGDGGCVLLRCTAAYPAPPSELNLATLADMQRRWTIPIGFSDHTLDGVAAVVAAANGACLIEKHFTLARSDGGPDAAFSMEPGPFADMARQIRAAHEMLGVVSYGPSP
jgi:N-acetylneuraminate synthase